ncbi:MAG: hypothetical protein MK086_10265 [Flavobacteriales bacterium]|nr:hypothetical protein [Flavobacteriales bacterium]
MTAEVLSGAFKESKPSGIWIFNYNSSWFSIEYLESDTIRKSAIEHTITHTLDSTFFVGYERYTDMVNLYWRCIDRNCAVWMTNKPDTLRMPLLEVFMGMGSGRIWRYYEGHKRVFE